MRSFLALVPFGILTAFASSVNVPRHNGVAPSKRHHELGARVANGTSGLDKRVGGVRFSYYNPEQTGAEVACGGHYTSSDYVAALNSAQWDNGALCGKTLDVHWGGKSVTITLVDECASGCLENGLDLTPAVFTALSGSLDAGYLYDGSWEVAGAVPSTSATPSPTTTKPKSEPSTTTTSSTTSKSTTKTISSSSVPSSSSFASSSSVQASSSVVQITSSTVSASTPSSVATQIGNLDVLIQAYTQLILIASNGNST
ncbi:hypothetical protein BC835DRAFT_1418749 [Cytidiella melzeri]|nr:hypothetical protein BC835DRAFT_1418749 [Cytidiella melzeri]